MIPFRPALWLPGPNLQTLWAGLVRKRPHIMTRRERLELPDGDFIDLDWADAGLDETSPLVIVVHGLEGSIRSRYAAGIMKTLHALGIRTVLMNLRGCSGEPNRLARRYHSGDTGDLAYLVDWVRARQPDAELGAVGYSLGGNVLLKWLGETGSDNPLTTAVAVSVPFQLKRSSQRLGHGLSRLYERVLLRSLKRSIEEKLARFELPLDAGELANISSMYEFDDRVTAPLHGFQDAEEYYERASSRQFLGSIQTPTLILHAEDDPFMYPDVAPTTGELSPQVQLELSRHGGHVGFVSGPPWAPRYWLDQRISLWLTERLGSTQADASIASGQ
ncbi:MAG: hydrolase [Gammaproteobacteria bacterium]|nr:hydrolase [Gammaproteobacteria bacterium]